MSTELTLPVALTCGDPAGIGPEIAAKAWRALGASLPFFWIGDPGHLPANLPVEIITSPADAPRAATVGLPVLPHAFVGEIVPGRPSAEHAPAVIEVIKRGVQLVMEGQASALCTAPISKRELKVHAAFEFPGHTEFLAHLAGSKRVVMMLASDELKVVPTTVHIPLSDVPDALTAELLEETLRLVSTAMSGDFGIENPRVAVAGLNPHAGEDGLLGREEVDWIAPLCQRLRSEGLDIRGPLPADTMFHAKARESYDVAVAMYHDQALIPIKTLAFDRGVNITLGLPFVRTSPDHGTAFDIAGKGLADQNSLVEALRMAAHLGHTRGRRNPT